MNKAAAFLASAIAVCLLHLSGNHAPANPLQVSGSFRSLNLFGESSYLYPEYTLSSNSGRLDANWKQEQSTKIEAAIDYQYFWSDPVENFQLVSNNVNRRLDMDKIFVHGNSGSSRLQVDRLNYHLREGQFDITVGRQAIGFGRILIYSPLDIIAPFAPDAIDTEFRGGVDAARGVYSYGLDGQLGALTIWGTERRYNSYLGTWTDNMSGVDLLLIGGKLRGRNVVGAGLAGSIGSLGLKGEISVHKGRDRGEPGGDLHATYTLSALEGWYRFDSGITLVMQYLFNGPGTNKPEAYTQVLASAPVREGLTNLLGRHYLIAAPSYEIHPLVSIHGLLIHNLQDDSTLFRPSLDISVSDDVSLQLFWTECHGEGLSAGQNLSAPSPRSEFGLRGDSGGLFFKWYF